MKCITKASWLAFLRGELDDDCGEEITEHLQRCATCRRLADELTAAFNTLDSLEGMKADPGFAARIAARIQELKPVSWWRRAALPALAAAAAVVSTFLGILMGNILYTTINADNGDQAEVSTYSSGISAGGPFTGGY